MHFARSEPVHTAVHNITKLTPTPDIDFKKPKLNELPACTK